MKRVIQPQHKLALLDRLTFADRDLDDGFVGLGHEFDTVTLQRADGGQGRVGAVAARCRQRRRQKPNSSDGV